MSDEFGTIKGPEQPEQSKGEQNDEDMRKEISHLDLQEKLAEKKKLRDMPKVLVERGEEVDAREASVKTREDAVLEKEGAVVGKVTELEEREGILEAHASQLDEVVKDHAAREQELVEAAEKTGPALRAARNIQQAYAKAHDYIEAIYNMTQNPSIIENDERRRVFREDLKFLLKLCEMPISEEFIENEERILQDAIYKMNTRYSSGD